MTRPEPEIRAEIERLIAYVRLRPHAKSDVEKYSAAIMVQALKWALGETTAPTVRVKL